jgi:hypothetical protein
MAWVCQAGGTVLIPSGPGFHLFVVLNNPTDFPTYLPQSCVLVSFSTIRAGPYDATRLVQAGAHPFIKDPSFVAYRQARMETAAILAERVDSGMYVAREPVTEQLRAELIAGLYESPLTPRYLKKLQIT